MIVFISIAILFLPLCPVKADFLIPYQLDGKIGYVDENLTVRIPAVWDYGSYLRNGEIALVRIDSDILKPQYGLIDTEGTFLVPLGDHRIIGGEGGEYYGGEDGYYLIVDYSSGLQGYYDIRNHYYALPKYTSIDPRFRDESVNNMLYVGSIVVNGEDQSASFINSATEDILCKYEYLEHGNPYHGKVLCMTVDGSYWIQSTDGTRIPVGDQFKLDSLAIEQGLFIVKNDEGYRLMSLSGKIVTLTPYRVIEYDPYDDCYYGTDYDGKMTLVYADSGAIGDGSNGVKIREIEK